MSSEAEDKCFVCLKTGGNLNIFSTYNICNDKEELYVEVINNCFNIEIGHDSGHNVICTNCSIKLRKAYTFKNDILQAVKKLDVLQVQATYDKEYTQLEYLDTPFENDYDINTVLNPETGQISYTLDKINDNKEIVNEPDTYLIDLDNDVIITKKVAEKETKTLKRDIDVIKENLPDNVDSKKKKPNKPRQKKEVVKVVDENLPKPVEENSKDEAKKPRKRSKKIITIDGLIHVPCTDEETEKPKKKSKAKQLPFTIEPNDTKCTICSSDFETNKALRVHMNTHYPDHVCQECGMAFASLARLRNHTNQAHVNMDEPLNCKYCEKIFTNVNTRNAHMWRVHTKPDPFKCPQCGERFKTYLKRLRHLQDVHGSTADYPCQYCDKKFAYAAARTKHVRTIHLQCRPHKCPSCPYSFARRRELDAHRANKHGDGEQQYQCNDCGAKFFFRSALKWHVNLHNRFSCTHCSSKFINAQDLEAHQQTHESQKTLDSHEKTYDSHLPLDLDISDLSCLDPGLHLDELGDYSLESSFWILGPEI